MDTKDLEINALRKEIDQLHRRESRLKEIDYYEAKEKAGVSKNDESPLIRMERALAVAEAEAAKIERTYTKQLIMERNQHAWELNQLKEDNQRLKAALYEKIDEKDRKIMELLGKGYTVRQIAWEIDLSAGAIQYRIKKLRQKGLI